MRVKRKAHAVKGTKALVNRDRSGTKIWATYVGPRPKAGDMTIVDLPASLHSRRKRR